MMNDLGKGLILLGAAIAIIGALVLLFGRIGFRGLPGDIRIEAENTRFYFPIVTCIVLSVLLTAGAWLYRWISGK